MKKKTQNYLATWTLSEQQRENPKILRIVLSEDFTRIDFGYLAPWMYIKGGWITIAPQTFIRVQGKSQRYLLKEARHIPLAPAKHNFESKGDWQVFTLFFEPIPIRPCTIDIIEQEDPSPHDFNYCGISLSPGIEILDW